MMRTLTVDGTTIRCHEEGSGSPVVYLHSGSGEVGPMPLFAELAGAGHRVLVPELPGFGESDRVTDWRSIEDVVFHLRRVLDVLDVGPTVLIGSSVGGWLAAELAVWFPERVRALVLIDAVGLSIPDSPISDVFGGPGSDLEVLMARGNPHARDMNALMAPVYGPDAAPDLPLRYMIRGMEVLARIGWNPYLHDPKLESRLAGVQVPTLVLWGEQDGLVPPVYGERYASVIPAARLEIVPECGHLPAVELPEHTAKSIAVFLDEAGVRS